MDATIIGKALTPISHERLLHLPQNIRENVYKSKKAPYSKRYADLKSVQLYHDDMKHEQYMGQWDQKLEKTRMNLSPIFCNMTLSETYNFAREQLKKYPVRSYTRKNVRTPTFTFPKVNESNLNQDTTIEKQSEEIKSDVISASRKTEMKDFVTSSSLDAEKYSRKVQRRTKSVIGHRKSRKKSARWHKKSTTLSMESKNEITLSSYMHGETMSPIRTSTSMPSRLTTVGSYKTSTNQPVTNLVTHRIKPLTTYGTRRNTDLHRPTRQSIDKSMDCKVDDLLLSSLNTSPNKKKNARELSMRIQLIHRYGNEDVITRHMEMKKKREIANRHEAKILELQANERKKEEQRLKIYALNKLMTRLEQEKFEEYKQSL